MPNEISIKSHDYQNTIVSVFRNFRESNDFSDVTLVGDDGCQIQAHKIILTSCSLFFQDVLKNSNPSMSFIYIRGVKEYLINSILDYIYKGKASICEDNIEEFLAFGMDLKIDGLENIEYTVLEPNEVLEKMEIYNVDETHISTESDEKEFGEFVIADVEAEDRLEQHKPKIVSEELSDAKKEGYKSEEDARISTTKYAYTLTLDINKFHCNKGKCRKLFSSEKYFESHKIKAHPNIRKFVCQECGLGYFTRKGLKVHHTRRQCSINIQCDICNHKFFSNHKLEKHKESRHREVYNCSKCDRKLPSFDKYSNHRKNCLRKTINRI